MAAATVDNKLQFYIWTGQKGSNLRSQLTLKLWHKAHKTLKQLFKTSKHFPSNQYRHLRWRSLWSLWGFRIRSRRPQRSCG